MLPPLIDANEPFIDAYKSGIGLWRQLNDATQGEYNKRVVAVSQILYWPQWTSNTGPSADGTKEPSGGQSEVVLTDFTVF